MSPSTDFHAMAAKWPNLDLGRATNPDQDHQHYCEFYQLSALVAGAESYHAGNLLLAGFRIAVQAWRAPDPKGTMYLVHGYWDHVGLYRHAIGYWLSQGYNVICFDAPGHGLSGGSPAAINDFDEYTQVFTALLSNTQATLTGPHFGFGQSTGGAVLLNYLIAHEVQLAGMVLLAPLVRVHRWHLVCIAHRLLHKFIRQVPRDMSKMGSHDQEFARFMRTDPLQYHYATTAWVGAMRKWANKFQHQAPLLSNSTPVLIIQGDNDNTVAWQFNCPLAKAKLPRLELVIIPGAEHNLVNESRSYREQVFHQASTFITSIAPSNTP